MLLVQNILRLSLSSLQSWRIQATLSLLFAVAAILLLLASHHHLLGFQCRLGTHGCLCHVSPGNLSHLSQQSKDLSPSTQEVVGRRPSLGFLGRDSRLFFHCWCDQTLRSNSCRCFSKSQLCASIVVVGGSPVCFRPRFPFLCPGQDKRQGSSSLHPDPHIRLLVCSLQQL